jgi:hypothetical protein
VTVKIGQIWDFVGKHTDAPPTAIGWRCIVVESNDSREAGPDSWVMRCLHDGSTKYMHRSARARGEWRRISWWRRLCDWVWRGEPLLKRSTDG